MGRQKERGEGGEQWRGRERGGGRERERGRGRVREGERGVERERERVREGFEDEEQAKGPGEQVAWRPDSTAESPVSMSRLRANQSVFGPVVQPITMCPPLSCPAHTHLLLVCPSVRLFDGLSVCMSARGNHGDRRQVHTPAGGTEPPHWPENQEVLTTWRRAQRSIWSYSSDTRAHAHAHTHAHTHTAELPSAHGSASCHHHGYQVRHSHYTHTHTAIHTYTHTHTHRGYVYSKSANFPS